MGNQPLARQYLESGYQAYQKLGMQNRIIETRQFLDSLPHSTT
jgi:hypothetical protein